MTFEKTTTFKNSGTDDFFKVVLFFKVVVSCVRSPLRRTFMWMNVFSKDVRSCKSRHFYVGINMISTLLFERCLSALFGAKKTSFEKMDVIWKDVFFLKTSFSWKTSTNAVLKKYDVIFEKHAWQRNDIISDERSSHPGSWLKTWVSILPIF